MEVFQLCSPNDTENTIQSPKGVNDPIASVHKPSDDRTPPILPPILPTEPPAYYNERSGPIHFATPPRHLWNLPSRTSYDSSNSDFHEYESGKPSDVEQAINQCQVLCEDMDRFKSLIHSNEARPEQIEMFNNMNQNAYNLLQSLKKMKTSTTQLKWLHDSDRGIRKRSPESEYEYDHKRPGQDINTPLPMKHYRRRANGGEGRTGREPCAMLVGYGNITQDGEAIHK
ncbi:hypothetical protein NQZ79_g1874 [Umbelopsis isabellina]|nr:hypothetical protein NQZ79_g1874 [Umbelopsis isabellina]